MLALPWRPAFSGCRPHPKGQLSQDAGHILKENYDHWLQDVKSPAALKNFCVDSHFLSAGNQFLMKSVKNITVSVLKNRTKPANPKENSSALRDRSGWGWRGWRGWRQGSPGTREELAGGGELGGLAPGCGGGGGGSWVDRPQGRELGGVAWGGERGKQLGGLAPGRPAPLPSGYPRS